MGEITPIFALPDLTVFFMAKFNGTWEEVVSMEKDIYCFGRTQDGHLFFANGSDIYIVGGQTVLHSQVFI